MPQDDSKSKSELSTLSPRHRTFCSKLPDDVELADRLSGFETTPSVTAKAQRRLCEFISISALFSYAPF